jgi:hypothetical protein
MAPLLGIAPKMDEELEVKWKPPAPAIRKPLLIAVKEAIADARGRRIAAN